MSKIEQVKTNPKGRILNKYYRLRRNKKNVWEITTLRSTGNDWVYTFNSAYEPENFFVDESKAKKEMETRIMLDKFHKENNERYRGKK